MPRTKISKNIKRPREAEKEEKIRDFEDCLDSKQQLIENKTTDFFSELEEALQMLVNRTNSAVLDMNFNEFMSLSLMRLSEWTKPAKTVDNAAILQSDDASKVDDGYLTEESNKGSIGGNGSVLTAFTSSTLNRTHNRNKHQSGRTPGPLMSAQSRRRSRSACDNYGTGFILASKTSQFPGNSGRERTSRNKTRATPASHRPKAHSSDRSHYDNVKSPGSAFLRWPRPGEKIVSAQGTPVVSQVMPDKFANVNIPVKDGVLSLRPKKLSQLTPDVIENIDQDTLKQIKTLQENLDIIMNMAAKYGK